MMPEFSEVVFCRSCGSRHTQRSIVTGGRTVDEVYALVAELLQKEINTMATIDDIKAAVTAETTLEGSLVTLLNQVVGNLKAAVAANDPAALQAVLDQLQANANTMSAALQANTPAAAPAPAAPVAAEPAPAPAAPEAPAAPAEPAPAQPETPPAA
jgi:hypothetical protein